MTYTDFIGGGGSGHEEEEEATNDYSSYWQSIPDPPLAAEDDPAAVDHGATNNNNNTQVVVSASVAFRETKQHTNSHRETRDSFAFRDRTNGCDKVEEEDSVVKKKRRRKCRRSMLPPSDDCNDNSGATALPPLAAATALKNEEVITKLVREYCALPNSQRANSQVARDIETLTSYIIETDGKKKSNTLTNLNDADTKRQFLLNVQPIVQEMEKQKQNDIETTKIATQCEVVKKKGGIFCYYDIKTGEEVMADEYKVRYTAMIVDKKREKKNREERRRVEMMNENDTGESSVEGKIVKIRSDDSLDSSLVFKKDDEEREVEVHPNHERCDDSNMDLDLSIDDSVVSCCGDGKANNGEKHQQHTCNEQSTETKHSNDCQVSTAATAGNYENESNPNNNSNRPLFAAGMNQASNDPRILAARRTLWNAIDTALTTYSQTILDIERAG